MTLTVEQDRWNSIVHELGHALVAQELGHDATWHVYRARTQDSRTWEGATLLPTNVPPEDRRIIGLAGAVAETLAGVIPISFEPSDLAIVGMLSEYTFSDTDAAYMGGGYTQEEALRCVSLIRKLKPKIIEVAVANGGSLPVNRLSSGAGA